MSDGPFRNSELRSRWKRYGEHLVNEAASPEELTAHACHSILGEVEMKVFTPLFNELKDYVEQQQRDLDSSSEIEAIFDKHQTSPWTDSLQRHFSANLQSQMLPEEALAAALSGAVKEQVAIWKNRIDEESICARDRGDMIRSDYQLGIERNREAFAAIRLSDISDALATGNKNAFKGAIKKQGLDEGPE